MYRGFSHVKKRFQHINNIVRDKKGDLVLDYHSIMASWGNLFAQLLNARGVNYVRLTEIHTAEPLVPKASVFKLEMVVEKLK